MKKFLITIKEKVERQAYLEADTVKDAYRMADELMNEDPDQFAITDYTANVEDVMKAPIMDDHFIERVKIPLLKGGDTE